MSFSRTEESVIQAALKSASAVDAKKALDIIDAKLYGCTSAKEQAEAILRKAVIYGVMRQFDDARRELQAAASRSPNDPDVLLQVDFLSATLYDQEGKPEAAFHELTKLAEKYRARWQEPDLTEIYQDIQVRRGLDAVTIKKFKEATAILMECLTFETDVTEKTKIVSNIGISYSELGEYQSAKYYLLRALEIGSTEDVEGLVHLHLAIAFAKLGEFQEAKNEFQKCEQRASEYGFELSKIYGWLSWVCKQLGELSESRMYQRLVRPT